MWECGLTLCDGLTEFFVGLSDSIEIPGSIYGVHHVEVDVLLRLFAAGEFMDDVDRRLPETFLDLAGCEGEGRHLPFDPSSGEFLAPGEASSLRDDLAVGGYIRSHHCIASELMQRKHGVAQALNGVFDFIGRDDSLGECECKWHSIIIWYSDFWLI